MSRSYDHNEFGLKQKIQLRIDGELLDREFRNVGEARQWLQREGYSKEEITRRVKFLRS
jgi:uncharacterized membrane protein YcaP (DUF421 family)